MRKVEGTISTAIITREGRSIPQPVNIDDPRPPQNPNFPSQSFGVGIRLNQLIIGGVKRFIESSDILDIPEYWEYNVTKLDVDGVINMDGDLNLI